MTGDEYRSSIRDGRLLFLDGEEVKDAASNPLLRVSVDWVASTYDRFHQERESPIYRVPRTAALLREQMALLVEADLTAASTAGCVALSTVASSLEGDYPDRIRAFVDRCGAGDLRVAIAEEDAGSLRVVDQTPESIVINGAKKHVTGAAVVHELFVVPSREVAEEDSAIACAVPVNADGVRIVNWTTAPRAEDDRHYPVSRVRSMAEGTVIFDHVLVPRDRIFLCGETSRASVFGETLGIWQRAKAVADQADRAQLLLGLAQTISEMNGIIEVAHVRDKLSSMAVYASMCRAGWEAAMANSTVTAGGMVCPGDSYIYAAKAYGSRFYSDMVAHLQDVSGGLVITCPTMADLDNPDIGEYVRKYVRTFGDVTAEDRMRIFHVIRDLTADTYAGWDKVVSQLVGGSMHEQRMSALDTYDLDAAKGKARVIAGL